MPMEPFCSKFEKTACDETRTVKLFKHDKLPDGTYAFAESYCNEIDCDCRRVYINVISEKNIECFATINYGWESIKFYKRWIGDKKMARDLQGPILAPGQIQSKYAPLFLDIFKEVIQDKKYVDRLKKHYSMVREVTGNKKSSYSPQSKTLQKYLREIEKEYDFILSEDNYEQIILEELDSPESLLNYFKDYMKINQHVISLEWGALMFLCIVAYDDMDVSNLEKYYKLLKNYPPNSYIEYAIGEMYFRYYGDFFKARDKFEVSLTLRQDDPHVHYELGFLYYLLGIFHKSREHYEKAVFYSKYGNCYSEIKARSLYNIAVSKINMEQNYEEGKKLLKEALVFRPDYPEAKEALSKLPGFREEKNNKSGGSIVNEIRQLFRKD
jgi:tetratricopeptide (TPR) repeat protein